MSSFQWALQYQEKAKRLLLSLEKIVGDGVIQAGHAFTYGKIKQPIQKKPVTKTRKEESSSASQELKNESDTELVTPSGEFSSGIIAFEQISI